MNPEKHRKTGPCPAGHEMTGDNLYICTRGWRNCRACRLASSKTSKTHPYKLGPLRRIAGPLSMKELAVRLDVSRSTMYRWKRNGLNYWAADRAAAKLGRHPSDIWDSAREYEEVQGSMRKRKGL